MENKNKNIGTTTLKVLLNHYRTKGSAQIEENGFVMSRSQNQMIWAKIDKNAIPEPIMNIDSIVIPIKNRESQTGTASVFFKFSKTDFHIFAETLGMRIASLFNTKTCYNCPAYINKDEPSIKEALDKISDVNNGKGVLVYSLLDNNEYLYTLMSASKVEKATNLVSDNFKTIQKFINEKSKDLDLRSCIGLGFALKKEYSYQYLFRDCFGDVDYTSRNVGIIHNTETNQISLSPQFDFGELLSILYKNKFCEPTLVKKESFEGMPEQEKLQALVDKINASKLEKHNSTPTQLAQIDTTENSQENINFITKKCPDAACAFLKDLNFFNTSQYIHVLVPEYSYNYSLISQEQGEIITEFIQARMDFFTKQLVDSLKQNSPEYLENFAQQNPEILALLDENKFATDQVVALEQTDNSQNDIQTPTTETITQKTIQIENVPTEE